MVNVICSSFAALLFFSTSPNLQVVPLWRESIFRNVRSLPLISPLSFSKLFTFYLRTSLQKLGNVPLFLPSAVELSVVTVRSCLKKTGWQRRCFLFFSLFLHLTVVFVHKCTAAAAADHQCICCCLPFSAVGGGQTGKLMLHLLLPSFSSSSFSVV